MSQWEAGRHYNAGDRVEYNGQYFNVIQSHTSQGDWLPPNVPALYGAGGQAQHGQQQWGQPPPQQWGQPPPQQWGGAPPQGAIPVPGPGTPGQPPAPPPPNQYSQQHGFDDKGSDESDADESEFDKKKLAMGIGGGLGLAALVGGGIYAYTKHKSKKAEEAKKEVWRDNATENDWQAGAEKRTRAIDSAPSHQKPPCYWVLVERPGDVPQNAIQVGHEADGTPLYAARGFYEGGLHIGKAGRHFNPPGAIISWGGQALTLQKYEILVGDPRSISWKRFDEKPYVRGWQPVDAGREQDGTFLFLAKTDNYNGGVHPGKVREDEGEIHFGYGDSEVKSRPFYIAAYA